MPGSATKLSVEERLDIQDLFACFAWAIDLGDKRGVLDCFTDDCVFDHLRQGRIRGKEQLAQVLERLWYERPGWWIGRQHLVNHFLIEPEDGGAHVRAFCQVPQTSFYHQTTLIFGMGTWDTHCVRQNGAWLFKHIHIDAWQQPENIGWQGSDQAWQTPAHITKGSTAGAER